MWCQLAITERISNGHFQIEALKQLTSTNKSKPQKYIPQFSSRDQLPLPAQNISLFDDEYNHYLNRAFE